MSSVLDSYVSNGDNSDRDTRVQIGSGNETDMEKQDYKPTAQM